MEELTARGLTANALALKLRVPANRLTEILNGKRGSPPTRRSASADISGRAPRLAELARQFDRFEGRPEVTSKNPFASRPVSSCAQLQRHRDSQTDCHYRGQLDGWPFELDQTGVRKSQISREKFVSVGSS